MSLKELCRTCLRSGRTLCSPLNSIQPKIDSLPNYLVCLRKVFSKLLITPDDNYPDKICTDCVIELQRTYAFMGKCERSENILKKMKNAEIRLKRLRSVSPIREHDHRSKKIKFEKDTYPNISQIRNENLEWNTNSIGYDKDHTDSEQFQVVVHSNGQRDPKAQNTFIVQHEDDNFEIKLLDHFNGQSDTTNDQALVLQNIKQEFELDLCTGIGEFNQIPSDQCNIDSFTCPGCYFQCRLMVNLEKHIIDKHMEAQLCKLCNQEFEHSTVENCSKSQSSNQNRDLLYHVKWHTGERPFKCEYCPKAFLRKHHLLEHLPHHTGERFKCEICPKSYIRKRELGYHMRDCHTQGVRTVKCKVSFF